MCGNGNILAGDEKTKSCLLPQGFCNASMETGSVGKLAVKHSADVKDGVHSVSTILSRPFDTVGHAQRQLTSEGSESNLKCETYHVTAIHAAPFNRNKSIHFICLIV